MRVPLRNDYRCAVKQAVDMWLSIPTDGVLTEASVTMANMSMHPDFNHQTSEVYHAKTWKFFAPMVGTPCLPVLLHAHISGSFTCSKIAVAHAMQLLTFNHKYPPYILITSDTGVDDFIKEGVLLRHAHMISFIVNTNGTGFNLFYCQDNTPIELQEHLAGFNFVRCLLPAPNPSEKLSCAYDKPSLSVATGFSMLEDGSINNPIQSYADSLAATNTLIRACTVDFSAYTYANIITTPADNEGKGTAAYENPPSIDSSSACTLCGKKRKGKYYYRVHGKLCSVCAQKVRTLGKGLVTPQALLIADLTLRAERERTRIANATKALTAEHLCPVCGCKDVDRLSDGKGYCPECFTELLFSTPGACFFMPDDCMVYQYKPGTRKITSISPISTHNEVRSCLVCGDVVTEWTDVLTYNSKAAYTVCSNCLIHEEDSHEIS